MKTFKYISRDDEVIVVLDGVPFIISYDDPRYEDLMEAIEDEEYEVIENLVNLKIRADSMLTQLAALGIQEQGTRFTYLGNPVDMNLSSYLRTALDNGNYTPVIRFISRLFENPSDDTRRRLFSFMEHNQLPIDDDGRFLAFKAVRSDYFDKRSGSVYNGVGTTVPKMSWSQVDTNSDVPCSRGYHACSKDYIVGDGNSGFWRESAGDRVVVVAVNPEDVGAIPSEYNGSKLRCRTYEVIADITDSVVTELDKVRIRMGLQSAANVPSARDQIRRGISAFY